MCLFLDETILSCTLKHGDTGKLDTLNRKIATSEPPEVISALLHLVSYLLFITKQAFTKKKNPVK